MSQITWLTSEELARMHETEAIGQNYRYVRMEDVDIRCDRTGRLDRIHAYVSLRGSLLLDGTPVALGGIEGENIPFISMVQGDIQSHLRDIFAPGMDLPDFIRQNIENEKLRKQRTALLTRQAEMFDHPGMTTILE